jgi:hypothetical protein
MDLPFSADPPEARGTVFVLTQPASSVLHNIVMAMTREHPTLDSMGNSSLLRRGF